MMYAAFQRWISITYVTISSPLRKAPPLSAPPSTQVPSPMVPTVASSSTVTKVAGSFKCAARALCSIRSLWSVIIPPRRCVLSVRLTRNCMVSMRLMVSYVHLLVGVENIKKTIKKKNLTYTGEIRKKLVHTCVKHKTTVYIINYLEFMFLIYASLICYLHFYKDTYQREQENYRHIVIILKCCLKIRIF